MRMVIGIRTDSTQANYLLGLLAEAHTDVKCTLISEVGFETFHEVEIPTLDRERAKEIAKFINNVPDMACRIEP